jgi:hypothetical protein
MSKMEALHHHRSRRDRRPEIAEEQMKQSNLGHTRAALWRPAIAPYSGGSCRQLVYQKTSRSTNKSAKAPPLSAVLPLELSFHGKKVNNRTRSEARKNERRCLRVITS